MSVRVEKIAQPSGTSVAVVTLDDPEHRNALSPSMVTALVGAFDELEADAGVGAVVVTGAPPAFCAGANLSNLGGQSGSSRTGDGQQAGAGDQPHAAGDRPDAASRPTRPPEEARRQSMRAIYEGFLRVGRSSLPTVAAVNGPAVGAGMNLALVCDVRLAGRSARFDTRFLDLGLHPGGGHTWMMGRLLGHQGAAAMVLFGQVLSGDDAVARGLVWDCVDDEALRDTALELAGRAASGPPELARRIKQTLRRMGSVDGHDEAVDIELDEQLWSQGQPFFAERLAALRARVSRRRS